MHVSIAIVGYRNLGDILRCLSALERSTHQDFEVIVCENGGSAAFDALRAAAPAALPGGQPVRIVLAPGNLGFGGGVNTCFRETPAADAWWVLNPDTQPHPDALAAQIRRLSVGDCEAVGCVLYLPDGRVQSYGGRWSAWLARPQSIGNGAPLEAGVDPKVIEKTQSYLNGASMLIGRRFLEVVGPMREEYFLYCEEVEWCLRAVALGMRLGFAPDALVRHDQGATTGAGDAHARRPRMPIYLGERNKLLLTRDCFPQWLAVATVSVFAMVVLRYARRGAWRQVAYGLSGLLAGVLNERGAPSWVEV